MLRVNARVPKLILAVYFLVGVVWVGPAPAQTKRSPVAPSRERVESIVREAYGKFRSDTTGKNADFIPYLAQVDSRLFGVAIVSTDNQVFELGDVLTRYSSA